MRIRRYIAPRLVAALIGIAAVLTLGVTAFVYSGDEHREAVKSFAREFFVMMEKASRVRRAPFNPLASSTPEGGTIQ